MPPPGIVGLGADESDALMEELFSYIEAPPAIYRHNWRVGDLIIWDNVALVHARTAFDPAAARTLQRVTVSGTPSGESVTQAARAASRFSKRVELAPRPRVGPTSCDRGRDWLLDRLSGSRHVQPGEGDT